MAKKTYDDYYNQYTQNIDTSAYDKLAKNYNASVDADTGAQINSANKSAQGQLKQAYITRMQDQRALADNMARAGIRGGATETSNMRLATNYGNTRNSINSQLASTVENINRTAAQNKLAYQQDIDAKKQAYIENRESEARQAAREDLTNAQNRRDMLNERKYTRKQNRLNRKEARNQRKYERKQTKRTQQIERYTAQYSKYFDTKQLEKMLKSKAVRNNPIAQQVINARIGYLKSPEYKAAKRGL